SLPLKLSTKKPRRFRQLTLLWWRRFRLRILTSDLTASTEAQPGCGQKIGERRFEKSRTKTRERTRVRLTMDIRSSRLPEGANNLNSDLNNGVLKISSYAKISGSLFSTTPLTLIPPTFTDHSPMRSFSAILLIHRIILELSDSDQSILFNYLNQT
ncbi:hypothetical protein G4B88_018102, partial [Cannabis sativa]